MSEARSTNLHPGSASPPQAAAGGVYTQIHEDIQSGKVPLPTMPHLVLQLRTAVREESSGFGTISQIIQTDPGVASFLLKLANSPAFATRSKATDLRAAVNRMGTASLVNIVTSYSVRQMFRSSSRELRAALRNVWAASARLGATCAVVARKVTRQNPDRALLAGLLANIGALPLIRALAEREDLANSQAAVEGLVERFGRQVGVMMLTQWEFDESLIEAVRHFRVWHHQSGEPDYADLVNVCYLLIRKSTEEVFVPPALHAVPAVAAFSARWPETDWSPSLLEDLRESVDETEADFRA